MSASAIYSLEPTTKGVVQLQTSKGPLIIHLFSREAPQSCKHFCQLIVDGAFQSAPFHRIVPGTLIQARTTTTTVPLQLPDETHSRLEFRARGFVALVREDPCEFFITLSAAPWLNRKHVIIGKLQSNSVFVSLKIGEGWQEKEIALEPVLIDQALIVEQPFEEVITTRISSLLPHLLLSSDKSLGTRAEAKKVKLSFEDESDEFIVIHPLRKDNQEEVEEEEDVDDVVDGEKEEKEEKDSQLVLRDERMLQKLKLKLNKSKPE